ncbi:MULTISPECIES: ABC transporter permease [unclassified Sphingopyxis]|jgi:ABC-2 type transport system permease protein|uniref:ABC transporter permease n=1 Tax=unclassified Sphingopyxis TaxID=2614943 RepID=UPI000730E0CD|nr:MULTISPECIES: ABC transporter permease [unclassified Sphingopyxis]KTE24193.1 multidrug ABC transporter permease [Sphingopyxis sp. H057]KTE50490.1 multidrug ABC transporter permease [Sphingopyxis sp. H073]KTE52579.1 multidrug ABC transporter permease [Sphingopyxis sp. H071]KTE63072.1 multidrug ABC transporter permease [Sphingopyxis sp. H107]KTE64961.1 multidrug ABC transporter permease [Sphingopyxis sp. H100]
MNDQPQISRSDSNNNAAAPAFAEPGVPHIRTLNVPGLQALYVKEVRRFFKVQLQTIWAPAVTTLLFLVIFTVALGGAGRKVIGVPFADFIAPGLIMMAMLQNSFANSSFSLLVGKIQGTIVDYLMPPLGVGELVTALIGAAVTRAILVGFALWLAMLLWPGVHVGPDHLWAVALFGVLGAMMLGFLGLVTSVWAEKFDHAAAVTNFVVTPLALLSGTFYSVDRLAPWFQGVAHANPVYYAIMGFRFGFIGTVDSTISHPVLTAALVLVATNIVLGMITYRLLVSGWKLKA